MTNLSKGDIVILDFVKPLQKNSAYCLRGKVVGMQHSYIEVVLDTPGVLLLFKKDSHRQIMTNGSLGGWRIYAIEKGSK